MKKVFGYVRVSSEDQAASGLSLAAQAEKIRAYCALNDLELVEIIEDAGISAKDMRHRPGFRDMLSRIYHDEAAGVIINKLDRAFRSVRDALATSEKLNKKGKVLISIAESLDTGSAIGRFFYTLMASLAELERGLVSERTVVALEQKRSRGEKLGGEAPYGYMAEDGKLVVNDEEAMNILRIRQLRKGGMTFRDIVDALPGEGILNRRGRPFGLAAIAKIVGTGTPSAKANKPKERKDYVDEYKDQGPADL
jgi:DNA invertase Pin-like site-specific DNA recombinase